MRSYARFLGLCCLILACDTKSDGNKDAGNDNGQHDAGGTGGDGDTNTADAGSMDAGGGGMDAGADAGGGDGDMTVDAGTDSGGGDGDVTVDAGHDSGTEPDAGHDAGTAWPTNGLRADYFDGKSFVHRVTTRVDEKIDFDWADNSVPVQGFARNDRWSARWMGEFEPLYSESYTFYASADDGIKVWINDQMVISNWNQNDTSTKASTPIALQANQRYSIRVEYFQGASFAHAKLEWESTSEARAVIPNSQLFPADMSAQFDIGVCTGANPATDNPDPTKPGCNSFESEQGSGSTYAFIGSTHDNVDCGPCSPVSWGPQGGRNIRFEVPAIADDPRSTVTMNIPRASAGKYILNFWMALERDALTDAAVVASVAINDGTPFDLTVIPTLTRDASTVSEPYEFAVDLKAGNNKVVVTGPDFPTSPKEEDLLRFDRITVENLDHSTSP